MKTFNRIVKLGGKTKSVNGTTIRVLELDINGMIMRCTGTTVPTGAGYAKGCLFTKTDAATGTKGLYENQGTTASASFNLVGAIGDTEIAFSDGGAIDDNNANELLQFEVVASAVNHVGVKNAATGNSPAIVAKGEADTGLIIQSEDDEEMLILDAVAGAVNEITIASAATGAFPTIKATGEADTGIDFENSEGEEILKLDAIATAVNEITIANAATGNGPEIQATGGDTDIDIELVPKGTGSIKVPAAAGVKSTVANVVGTFIPNGVQQALSGAGAVNLTTFYTAVTNTGADALTLADSTVVGQLKKVQMIVDPGTDSTLTFNTNATIVFADVGDYAVLVWNGADWIPVELGNDVDGATAPAYTPAS